MTALPQWAAEAMILVGFTRDELTAPPPANVVPLAPRPAPRLALRR